MVSSSYRYSHITCSHLWSIRHFDYEEACLPLFAVMPMYSFVPFLRPNDAWFCLCSQHETIITGSLPWLFYFWAEFAKNRPGSSTIVVVIIHVAVLYSPHGPSDAQYNDGNTILFFGWIWSGLLFSSRSSPCSLDDTTRQCNIIGMPFGNHRSTVFYPKRTARDAPTSTRFDGKWTRIRLESHGFGCYTTNFKRWIVWRLGWMDGKIESNKFWTLRKKFTSSPTTKAANDRTKRIRIGIYLWRGRVLDRISAQARRGLTVHEFGLGSLGWNGLLGAVIVKHRGMIADFFHFVPR